MRCDVAEQMPRMGREAGVMRRGGATCRLDIQLPRFTLLRSLSGSSQAEMGGLVLQPIPLWLDADDSLAPQVPGKKR
jgi:hypothetical protein